ncbi:ANTAR domain-containing protein [Williamsia deligens]|nr:ANTAR domain-containing protein [Williamsia deligens]
MCPGGIEVRRRSVFCDAKEQQLPDSASPSPGAQQEVPYPVGAFRFSFDDDRWEFSPECLEMLHPDPSAATGGCDENVSAAGSLERATATLAGTDVRTALDLVRESPSPLASRHTVTDASGRHRHLLVIAERVLDADRAVGASGQMVDVSGVFDDAVGSLDTQVNEFVENRSVIEQAKGMMMLAYSFGDQHAYDVLAWRSQHTNTKVRALAAAVVREVPSAVSLTDADRSAFDHILLSAHETDDE